MIYPAAALLLLGSTRKLRSSSSLSFHSLKYLNPLLLRNLSTATERSIFETSNSRNQTTDDSSYHPGYTNTSTGGDPSISGFYPNSNEHRLNQGYCPVPGQTLSGSYRNGSNQVQSIELFNQKWQSSDCSSSYVDSNGNGTPQESTGLVHSSGGQSQTWISPDAHVHFQQDGTSGHHGSLEELDAICRNGKVKTAVDIIKSWRNEGYIVDLPRLLWLAQLCGDAQVLEEAKVVHEFITSSASLSDINAYNSIIEMYSSCGSVEDALTVFNRMPEKNLQTWCAMIRCFAKNGQGEEGIDMFSRFKEEGNRPDGEIFKEIFFTCGVLGDIDEGLLHFESMSKDYGIIPSMEHYVSLVKMVAESGCLDEALWVVESMEPDVDLWETLMNLSWVHGDVELGDRCRDMVEQLDASRLSKEAKAGLVPIKPSEIAKERLRRLAREKTYGLEYQIIAGDISRPENSEAYAVLKSLKEHMVEIGFVAESKTALHDVDQESKDENLFNHSERYAFVTQMLRTPPRTKIQVMKNLRVCIDCHNALKLMSKIVGRVLVSRDIKRFHHMEDGVCSCKDYW